MKKTPTTIIMGFLGSGKTTIIMGLVEYLAGQNKKIVYIKNEVGDADLDTKLMNGKVTQTKELLNGCVCCTLVGPLLTAIDELIDQYSPDRIIIESAGTADPASLALAVESNHRLNNDGVISIIDVVNFLGYDDLTPIARQQAQFTDLIVFNKVEQVSEEQKLVVVGYVRELNEKSPIVEAPKGILDPKLAFGLESQFNASDLHLHHHSVEDNIDAFSFAIAQPLDEQQFLVNLDKLPKNVIRIKGVVFFDNGKKKILNAVGRRFDFMELPEGVEFTQTELIVIGFGVREHEKQIIKLFT